MRNLLLLIFSILMLSGCQIVDKDGDCNPLLEAYSLGGCSKLAASLSNKKWHDQPCNSMNEYANSNISEFNVVRGKTEKDNKQASLISLQNVGSNNNQTWGNRSYSGEKLSCSISAQFDDGTIENGSLSLTKSHKGVITRMDYLSDEEGKRQVKREEVDKQNEIDRENEFNNTPTKEYPYMAHISCSNMVLYMCFLGDRFTSDTAIEINNGGEYAFYNGYHTNEAGNSKKYITRILLRNNFVINAQNSIKLFYFEYENFR
ncbi:hypothetical protein [Budvicia aquatica]|uniref:Lipoprotein n=1 Tax=Budvicia aquatica TaxID=82979 RepID=A0A484ZRI5_9GAMM|nr:hypothetical protein [Budvicia aquatica]VFS51397.1 Uncharacterised protein [Budvicia aquatica]